MLRAPLLVAIALAIAFAGGVWSSAYALRHVEGFDSLTIGPWRAWPQLQTARADPYALAYRARAGAILLGEAEGLAFTASTDSRGHPLSGMCGYEIKGTTPAARFWTLRIIDPTGRPVADGPALPASFQSHDVLRDADGSFVIHATAHPVSGNWMVLDHPGPVVFALTLFDTPAAGNAGLMQLEMPAIERQDCGHA